TNALIFGSTVLILSKYAFVTSTAEYSLFFKSSFILVIVRLCKFINLFCHSERSNALRMHFVVEESHSRQLMNNPNNNLSLHSSGMRSLHFGRDDKNIYCSNIPFTRKNPLYVTFAFANAFFCDNDGAATSSLMTFSKPVTWLVMPTLSVSSSFNRSA